MCSLIILRAKDQLRIRAPGWFERDDPKTPEDRNGTTTGDENIGVDVPMVVSDTGSIVNEFENLNPT